MMFNKLIALAVGVFFYADLTFANENPEKKLREAFKKIQSLFERQASEREWSLSLAKISRDLLGPKGADSVALPNVPYVCGCGGLGIWSTRTTVRGDVTKVQAWIIRVDLEGRKWLSFWQFEFVFRNGGWYLYNYS